jgi:hypothetical protein
MLLALTPLMPHQTESVPPLVMGYAMCEASNWSTLRSYRALSNQPLTLNMATFFLYLPANLLAQLLLPPANSPLSPIADPILLLKSALSVENPGLSSAAAAFSRHL